VNTHRNDLRLKRRKIARQSEAFAESPTNARIAGGPKRAKAIVGSFSCEIPSVSDREGVDLLFEMKRSTSWPRDRRASATARPGKRWPRCPPQAITVFMNPPPWCRRQRAGPRAFASPNNELIALT
jgi:hypothetical protein